MVKQNINLYLASPRGFCAGVDRAVKIVEQAIKKYGAPIYVRHEIVHNKDVVKSLENLGAIFVDEITDAPESSTIIFSAHGVPKSVFDNAKNRKMLSIDATCPLVTKVHNETIKHFNNNRKVLLIGHKDHPEVIGTMGQIPKGNVILIQDSYDAMNLHIEDTENLAYATQTTLSVDDTKQIIDILKKRFPKIKGPSTEDICYATTNRQLAVKSIAKICNYVLVIGAKNSSNSQRLVEVAKTNGVLNSFLISEENDLNIFLKNLKFSDSTNIGLTAGASAPETLVQVLISKLKKNFDVNLIDHEVIKEDIVFNLPKLLR
ncbi:MAG: 4-hydroxy-3-methylbut-2-enyl diphosphate reductase [SAR116 cluster bacterium]|nr:4-hydroxy-3-methylbut-2-enyl diphosphate reductase [SAR116 cluster bacterium]RPH10853.1 MAG: 4-hydroxy-3-methylbut-2-enyl diphosphate reductase [Alphaproteobacteria bacterium TMED54]|tara:strand:+ start:485 stop:1438 length:954 start_codon:yes stop_codon:yes gene_type:complete